MHISFISILKVVIISSWYQQQAIMIIIVISLSFLQQKIKKLADKETAVDRFHMFVSISTYYTYL